MIEGRIDSAFLQSGIFAVLVRIEHILFFLCFPMVRDYFTDMLKGVCVS